MAKIGYESLLVHGAEGWHDGSGTVRALPQDDLPGVWERLSAAMEERLAPKPVWTMDKMSDGVAEKMMRMIAPIAMEVSAVEGTWKLGQNKAEDVRIAAGEAVSGSGIGQEVADLGGLMREPPC